MTVPDFAKIAMDTVGQQDVGPTTREWLLILYFAVLVVSIIAANIHVEDDGIEVDGSQEAAHVAATVGSLAWPAVLVGLVVFVVVMLFYEIVCVFHRGVPVLVRVGIKSVPFLNRRGKVTLPKATQVSK